MNPLDALGEHIEELVRDLNGIPVAGTNKFMAITPYTVWMLISAIVLLIIVFAAKKRESLVPHGRFLNGVEYVVEWVRTDVGEGVIGKNAEPYMPLLLTVFFFIVINNLLGLIPGAKAGTGTFSATVAISLIVFIYFNGVGMKKQGVGKYILSLAPKGIGPIAPLVWCIELVSLFLRLFTLAVRLFANMYSGHIVMGAFAVLASLFFTAAIQSGSLLAGLPSVAWIILLLCMYAMELLVAVVQAYVFTLLSAVYISLVLPENAH